uniref:Uncharacterized protein n=1 Tax=Romanomermis culicivorax TaxID=13658 RepID=A0A915ITI1_ROMCU
LPNPPPQHHQQQPLHYSQSLGYGQSSSTSAAMSTGFHPTGVNSDLGSLSGIGGPTVSHQQRHSIQLPVQYAQGHFAGVATTGNPSLYSFPGSQSSSPGYQADSPHSGPNSPATTANSESPSNASQQGQSSPGSPYYSLPAQLQNINIEASDFQPQQSVYISGDGSGQQQLQFRVPVNPNSTNQYQQMNCSTQYQIRTNMVTPPPYQPPNNKIAQQQPCEIYGQIQPPLPSPNSGKIPNIILTGPCDTNAASTSVTFVDPAVAMLSSNLRLTLDPSDLESLQVLSNEHDLIDADTEDALRGDRIFASFEYNGK